MSENPIYHPLTFVDRFKAWLRTSTFVDVMELNCRKRRPRKDRKRKKLEAKELTTQGANERRSQEIKEQEAKNLWFRVQDKKEPRRKGVGKIP